MSVITQDMAFYAFEISDNLAETPEGFLIAQNVPIARTGSQTYRGHEIGGPHTYDEVVTIYRDAKDVFADSTLKSAEGKSVTDDHPPPSTVTPGNFGIYHKGHAQNIRRDGEFIVADLLIMDPLLIKKVKDGEKRQVSCGYTCRYKPFKDGYRQTDIVINHIAVVPKGRAGPKVAIKDHETVINQQRRTIPMGKNETIARVVTALVKDGASEQEITRVLQQLDAEPEEKKEEKKEAEDSGLIKTLLGMISAKPAKDAESEETAKKQEEREEKEEKQAEDRLTVLEDKFDQLLEALTSSTTKDEDKDDDKKETEDDDADGDGDDDDQKKAADAAFAEMQNLLKPAIAKLAPAQQKVFKDAMKGAKDKVATDAGIYAKIRKAVADNQKEPAKRPTTDGAATPQDPAALGKLIQAKFNIQNRHLAENQYHGKL